MVVDVALAAGAALLQRFYASGAMFHHLQVIKLLMLPESVSEEDVKENLVIRTAKFLRAHAFLKCAAWLLVTAALLLSVAFIRMMFLA